MNNGPGPAFPGKVSKRDAGHIPDDDDDDGDEVIYAKKFERARAARPRRGMLPALLDLSL